MNPFRKVTHGQKVNRSLHPVAINRLLGMAEKQGGGESTLGSFPAMNLVVMAQNNTGEVVPRFGVLEVTGILPEIDAGTFGQGLSQFKTLPCLTVGLPSSTPKKLVIASEPIKENEFGDVVISGVTQCKMHVKSASHGFAKAIEGEAGKLESSFTGPVEILWSEGVGDDKWALVRIGGEPDSFRVARFQGYWESGQTKTVQLLDDTGTLVSPTVEFNVVNFVADFSTNGQWRKLGACRYGSTWVMVWFQCN
jgi:hypothetical protein